MMEGGWIVVLIVGLIVVVAVAVWLMPSAKKAPPKETPPAIYSQGQVETCRHCGFVVGESLVSGTPSISMTASRSIRVNGDKCPNCGKRPL